MENNSGVSFSISQTTFLLCHQTSQSYHEGKSPKHPAHKYPQVAWPAGVRLEPWPAMWRLVYFLSVSLWHLVRLERPPGLREPGASIRGVPAAGHCITGSGCGARHVSDQQLEVLTYVLGLYRMQDARTLQLLLEGLLASDIHHMAGLNAASIINKIKADPSLHLEFARKYALHQNQLQRRFHPHNVHDGGSGNIGHTDLSEEDLYEECWRDYESFIAPITTPLSSMLLEECEEVGASVPCRNGTLPPVPRQDWAPRSEYTGLNKK